MKNVKCTITAGKTYEGYTDDNGILKIKGFTGIENGTYSIIIQSESFYKYGTIKYFKDTSSYRINMAKFDGCSFYPKSVTMSQNGTNVGSNKIQLDDESLIDTNVEIYNEVNSNYMLASVKLMYYNTDDEGNLILAMEREIDITDEETQVDVLGKYTTVKDTVAANALPENTKVYVSVTGKMNGANAEDVILTTEKIFTGYELTSEIVDDSIPVLDDVANVPGAQSAFSLGIEDLDVPFLGFLDFGISGKNGGYFVRKADPNDPSVCYLVAGFDINSVCCKNTPAEKAAAASALYKDMNKAKENGDVKGDTSNTKMIAGTEETVNKEGETKAGEAKKPSKVKAYGSKSTFFVYPAVMMKWGLKQTNQNGEVSTKLISEDLAIGFDELFTITKPFIVGGVPVYVTFTMSSEIYLMMNASFDADTSTISENDEKANVLYDQTGENGVTDLFFAVPYIKIGLKGGVGLNNFVDLYLTMDFKMQAMVDFLDPVKGTDGGFEFGYSGGIGGDLLIVGLELDLTGPPLALGNRQLLDELKPLSSLKSTTVSGVVTGTSVEEAGNQISDRFDSSNIKLSLMDRPYSGNLFKLTKINSQTLCGNAFKGTNVKIGQWLYYGSITG